MKKQNWWLSLLIAICMPCLTSAQSSKQEQEEEKKEAMLVYGYFEGYELDEDGMLQKDTVFFVNTQMKIRLGWYRRDIDSENYTIISYPEFSKAANDTTKPVDALSKSNIKVYKGLWHYNNKKIAIKTSDFDKLKMTPIYSIKRIKFVTGQLTVPFKLRPAIKGEKFQLTTDVTLGAYGGLRMRLSKTQDVFMTVPVTLGLSYINLNSNNTTTTLPSTTNEDRIVPGVSWSSGVLFQINRFNAGFVFGKDYASQVAEDWIYHNKFWYSFAIGYSFSISD